MKLYAVCNIYDNQYWVISTGKYATPAVYKSESSAKRVKTTQDADCVVEIDLEKCKII